MKIDADKDLLIANVDQIIDKVSKRKSSDKSKTTIIVTYGAIASAITTILIGLNSYLEEYAKFFSVTAMSISASVTVVNAWDKLFSHKRLWIMQSEALNSLKELKEDLMHLEKCGKLNQEATNECYQRYKEIYAKWNNAWRDLRMSE